MNKKVFMTFLVVAFRITSHAGNIVTLNSSFDDRDRNHRYEIPVVTDEGSEIVITSDTLVSDVRVIIKDVSGTVISDELLTLHPSDNIVNIPEEYQNDKYSIELYYDENCLYGYFTNL